MATEPQGVPAALPAGCSSDTLNGAPASLPMQPTYQPYSIPYPPVTFGFAAATKPLGRWTSMGCEITIILIIPLLIFVTVVAA